jgi:hypothetical protein
MCAGQREFAQVMIEVRVMPVGRLMAGSTVCAILTVMLIALVAGVAIQRRAFVLPIDMARFTLHLYMFPLELERCQVVIELGRSPAIDCVTLAAIEPEASLMRLIVMMAGIALLGRYGEVADEAGVDVTLHTGKPGMLPQIRI